VLHLIGAEQDRHDVAKWHTPQGILSVTGAKFMNWQKGVGGGGAIDLVIHLQGLGFKAAVEWLWHHFPSGGPTERTGPPRGHCLRLPPEDTAKLLQVKRYLVQDRSLAPSLIESLIEAGRLYGDTRGNAVFLLLGKEKRPVGAELRGTTQRPWRGMAPGSRKDLGYFSVSAPHATTVVLCESAIDALSCFVLDSDRLCVSTSGARPNPRWLSAFIDSGYEVYCGFDADPTGDDMAHAMIDLHPTVKRLRPPLHDWNDVLASRS
jgi:hypothetical protein